jgi:hypothetical protein
MFGRIKFARVSAGILAALGLCVVGGEAGAQQAATAPPEATANIAVKSMTSMVYKAVDQPKIPQRYEGAGAMDGSGTVIKVGGAEQIFFAFTESRARPKNDPSGNGNQNNVQDMQGAFGISSLAADGSLTAVVPVTAQARRLGKNNGNGRQRNFMKPQINAVGKTAAGDTANVVTLISTEQNGNQANLGDLTGLPAQQVINQSNGNPQVVAIVQDPATGKVKKEYNIITLLLKSIGQNNDQQQWGTPELAEAGNGLVGVSFQRNNQTCWLGVMQVNLDGTIEAKSLLKNENQCQHGKPSASVVPGTVSGNAATFATVHVRADNQPAEIGIAADLIAYDGTTGKAALKKTASKLIAKSEGPNGGKINNGDMRLNKYATQPTAAMFAGANGPVLAVTYAMANPSKANKGNGHAGAANITNVVTLDGKLNELDHKDSGTVLLGGARHARGWASQFGEVSDTVKTGAPAVAILAGSSIGAGAAGMNVLTIDPATGKMNAVTRDRAFTIADNSDIAGFATMGKTNPQDQAGAFLTMVKGNITNTSTKYPEVKSFAVTVVNGPEDPAKSTRDSLYLSLVPQTWAAGVKVNPAGVTAPEAVPAGPTPQSTTAPVPPPIETDPSNADPAVATGGSVTGPVSASGDPTSDPTSESDPSTSSRNGTYGKPSADSGCSTSGAGSSNGSFGGSLSLLGLGLAAVLRARRARRSNSSNKKEQ